MSYNLISTITNLPLLVGCKEFPSSPQGMGLVKLIQDFINEEYRFTGQQVTDAFKMSIKRELFLDGRRIDPSTFGQHLSVNIVGQVLTAYKEHKQGNNSRPSNYNYKQLPEAPFKPITPAESWELVLKFALEDGKPPFAAPYLGAYEYLVENKQISPVRKASNKSMFSNFESPERTAVEQYLMTNTLKRKTA